MRAPLVEMIPKTKTKVCTFKCRQPRVCNSFGHSAFDVLTTDWEKQLVAIGT